LDAMPSDEDYKKAAAEVRDGRAAGRRLAWLEAVVISLAVVAVVRWLGCAQ
jgi:hypothetical protein